MRARRMSGAGLAGRIGEGVPLVIAVFVVAMIAMPVLVQVSGIPEKQARMREAQRAEAERWDAAFCEKYGMPRGTERHRACLNDLLDLRRRERARFAEQAEDLL